MYFNPRSRKGSDGNNVDSVLIEVNFNPRSRKGSDQFAERVSNNVGQFQSTLPQGERRPSGSSAIVEGMNFNPRSRKGSDRTCGLMSGTEKNFNPRSRKGSDADANNTINSSITISIHAPARGATAIITNFHTQLLFKITIFSYIASPLSFPSSLFPDI